MVWYRGAKYAANAFYTRNNGQNGSVTYAVHIYENNRSFIRSSTSIPL